MPRAASQLSGEYCQGRIPLPWPLTSDQDDPGPLSLCVRFQVISRGGIVNGMVTQLWRIWSSQCLFFSAEMVQHQSQTFYRNVLLMFTNHRPPCWQRLNITDKTRSYRVSMSGCHYAPLAIVTRLICLICLIVPDLVLTHSPLSAPPPSLLMALAAAQTNFGSDARPRTQQFLRELYTYNISITLFLVLYHIFM